MEGWEPYRDREFLDHVRGLGNSRTAVMKDLWFKNGYKADLVVYSAERNEFELTDFYTEAQEERDHVNQIINSLRSIDDLLHEEGYRFRSGIKRTDNISGRVKSPVNENLGLNYSMEDLMAEVEDVISSGFDPRVFETKS